MNNNQPNSPSKWTKDEVHKIDNPYLVRYTDGKRGYTFPQSLLDQLRREDVEKYKSIAHPLIEKVIVRKVQEAKKEATIEALELIPTVVGEIKKEAKKELLDEIEDNIISMRPIDIYKQNVISEIHRIRAKTLGEK